MRNGVAAGATEAATDMVAGAEAALSRPGWSAGLSSVRPQRPLTGMATGILLAMATVIPLLGTATAMATGIRPLGMVIPIPPMGTGTRRRATPIRVGSIMGAAFYARAVSYHSIPALLIEDRLLGMPVAKARHVVGSQNYECNPMVIQVTIADIYARARRLRTASGARSRPGFVHRLVLGGRNSAGEPDATSRPVRCNFNSSRQGGSSLALRSTCSAYAIISRSVSADLFVDSRTGRVVGTYTGARVGAASLSRPAAGIDPQSRQSIGRSRSSAT